MQTWLFHQDAHSLTCQQSSANHAPAQIPDRQQKRAMRLWRKLYNKHIEGNMTMHNTKYPEIASVDLTLPCVYGEFRGTLFTVWTFWLLVCLQQDPRQPEIPWGFHLTRWDGNKQSMDNLKQNSSPAHRPKTKKGNQTFWLVDESSITANRQSRQAFCTCEAPAKNKLISSWFYSQNKMHQFLTTMDKSYHTTHSVAVISPWTKTIIRG
jgi:hypothetical protein